MDRRAQSDPGVAHRCARWVVAAILLIPAVVILYVPGALVGLSERLLRRNRSPWVLRRARPDEVAAGVRRPRRAVHRPDQIRRRGIAAVLVLGTVGAAALVRAGGADAPASDGPTATTAIPTGDPASAGLRFSDLPAYAGVGFADELQDEQRRFAGNLVEDPTTGLAAPDFAGRFTTVDDGVRRSLASTCERCPEATAWLVGGSAAFGLGQRDDHTIASELVRLAALDGVALTIRNRAVPGWTSAEELAALRVDLEERDAPDAVVSLTGYNDAASGLIGAVLDDESLRQPRVLDADAVDRFLESGRSVDDVPGGVESVASASLDRLMEHQREARAAVEAAGGQYYAFFQPDALASDRQFAPVRDAYRPLPPTVAPDLDAVLEAMSRGAAPEVRDLRHLFDENRDSVFGDWVHTNEQAAREVAAAIYEEIRPRMLESARSGG